MPNILFQTGLLALFSITAPTSNTDTGFSLLVNGLKRTYLVHFPQGADRSKTLPVVLGFHGGGGTAEGFIATTQLDEFSDQKGFLAVYPQGVGKQRKGKLFGTWNAGRCCGEAMENKIDDVGFISALIEDVANHYSIDRKRIFVTGHSNGAAFAYRLACELSEKIAAIGPVSSVGVVETCQPKRTVPVIHLHGLDDPCSLYKGGICGGCFQEFINRAFKTNLPLVTRRCSPVEDYVTEWKTRNHCRGKEKVTSLGDLSCTAHEGCEKEADVTLCRIKNSGHSWPGGAPVDICAKKPPGYLCQQWKKTMGRINPSVNANVLLWDFFQRHPLP